MVDDNYYITPHEAALAVVATAMKKSRLKLEILVINSIMGAMLFSAGGMLDLLCQAQNQGMMNNGFEGIVNLLQGAVYSIGLFYVISMGMELFNSNILFFSVGVMRGAVTIMDLIISWFISFWVNLATTIFVVYLICHVSGVTSRGDWITGSIQIAETKESFTFMQTFLKGVAGNFFVSLAVYLQIMVKPLHVKLCMIFLPIFTFVAMGFTHVVADMFLIPAGIFNNCKFGWGTYFWKLLLPGALGNMVGGSFFGIMIPWYLHLVVIEQDMEQLQLPAYEERDEQPMLNMDSRVVRVPTANPCTSDNSSSNDSSSTNDYNIKESDSSDVDINGSIQAFHPTLSKVSSRSTMKSYVSANGTRHRINRKIRSPKGVFPVADMGLPLKRERTIASAYIPEYQKEEEDDDYNNRNDEDEFNKTNPYNPENEKISEALKKVITRSKSRKEHDIESVIGNAKSQQKHQQQHQQQQQQSSILQQPAPAATTSSKIFRHFSFGGGGRDTDEISRRLSKARITNKAAALSNDIAGIHTNTVCLNFHNQHKPSVGSIPIPKNSKNTHKTNRKMSSYNVNSKRASNSNRYNHQNSNSQQAKSIPSPPEENINQVDDDATRSIDSFSEDDIDQDITNN